MNFLKNAVNINEENFEKDCTNHFKYDIIFICVDMIDILMSYFIKKE